MLCLLLPLKAGMPTHLGSDTFVALDSRSIQSKGWMKVKDVSFQSIITLRTDVLNIKYDWPLRTHSG